MNENLKSNELKNGLKYRNKPSRFLKPGRFVDFLLSIIGLLILLPVLLVIMLCIPLDSRGGIFFLQTRVGKGGKDFRLIKFRTMARGADKLGDLTVGSRDSRITRFGYLLRRFKLDELPQLINVLIGDMSLVGPRPELRKYVEMYTEEQKKVLTVRPGLTDYASIEYVNENELLGLSANPEKTYTEEVMPAKIQLNMRFINDPTTSTYLKILYITLFRVFNNKPQ